MIQLTSHFLSQTIPPQYILSDKEHRSHFTDTILSKFYVCERNWITIQIAKVQPRRVEPKYCFSLSVIPD